jgi:hypothetical protein
MKVAKSLLIGASVLGIGALGSGGAALASSTSSQPVRARDVSSPPVLANHPFSIAIYPNGRRREHVVGANFAVQPGVAVRITIVNYTQRPHTLTTPGLGTSFLIRAGTANAPVRTTFSFVGNKYGVFRWRCLLPCGQDMSGYVYAIIGEP